MWETKVIDIDFENQNLLAVDWFNSPNSNLEPTEYISYDELIFAVGKSGIDFAQQLANQYEPTRLNLNQYKLVLDLKHHNTISKN
jgi:uncharacterized FAD-dependent dehydrogenase